MTHPRLRVRGLSVSVGGRTLVDRVGLDVGAGEVLGVCGPSGVGKSVMLLAIAGVRPAGGRVAGEIHLDAQPIHGLPPEARSRLGLSTLLQDLGLFADRSVLENVIYPLRRRGVASVDAKRRAMKILERLQIADLAERIADRERGGLSGGQQQRVALGRLLVTDPTVLLLDEPLRGLDESRRLDLMGWIRLLALEGRAVVLVSHQADELDLIADHVVRVEAGTLTASESRTPGRPTFSSTAPRYAVNVDGRPTRVGMLPRLVGPDATPGEQHFAVSVTVKETRRTSAGRTSVLVQYAAGGVAWLNVDGPDTAPLEPGSAARFEFLDAEAASPHNQEMS